MGVVRTMVARLRTLQSQARQPKTHQRAGRLDRARLTAPIRGDTRAFRKPGGLGRGKSRAWSMVLDASVSMGRQADQVRQVTGIIGATLDELGDPFEITEFGGKREKMGVNKTFDQQWSPAQAYAYDPYGGDTYYSDAATRAAYALAGRDEEAKIMFFITDGGPGETYDEIRKQVVEPIRRQGVIMVPIFLGTAAAAQGAYDEIFGPRQWLAVPDVKQLPRLVYEYLESFFVTD
jgi:nitric oxide reductase activation protein